MNAQWGEIKFVSDAEERAAAAEAQLQRDLHLAGQCACKLAGPMPYLLEIEENRVTDLKCTACGKSVMAEWIEDLLSTTTDLPVTVTWVKEADDYWTGESGDFYGEISPRPEASDEH